MTRAQERKSGLPRYAGEGTGYDGIGRNGSVFPSSEITGAAHGFPRTNRDEVRSQLTSSSQSPCLIPVPEDYCCKPSAQHACAWMHLLCLPRCLLRRASSLSRARSWNDSVMLFWFAMS
jgi:hypothetical protein